ncbi:MAG TPA: HIT domain-containing protein [Candidatus Dormibacteraeota bacterium]
MKYIGTPPEPGCLFCRLLDADPAEDRQNLVVWRGANALVLMNRFPYNNGHLMVAPRAHVPSLADLSDSDAVAMHQALRSSLAALQEVMSPEGYNVGANLGRPAGAGIPDHVHLHVVPRWNGDTNFMPVLGEVKVINEHLDRTWEKLRAAFKPPA